MYDYARWLFVERDAKQKFDNIAAGHEAALIAMGKIAAAKTVEAEDKHPPFIFQELMDKYRKLKFIQRATTSEITLIAREMLNWQDLEAFKSATGEEISMLEAELIMGIDAIFEGRDNG
ncbi:hypothetical protein BCA73_22840 [Salmonella enterica subsp. enterica serovar Enteritidis]|nr:hypothetical protein BCA73_22840 [Salmonella enterica subsp. enterica serovar Enteritidis]